jgi:hypothetical protein
LVALFCPLAAASAFRLARGEPAHAVSTLEREIRSQNWGAGGETCVQYNRFVLKISKACKAGMMTWGWQLLQTRRRPA